VQGPCTSAPVLFLGVFGTNVWPRSGSFQKCIISEMIHFGNDSFPHGLADERDLLYGIGPIPQNPGDLQRPHLHLGNGPSPLSESATYFLPFPFGPSGTRDMLRQAACRSDILSDMSDMHVTCTACRALHVTCSPCRNMSRAMLGPSM